MKGLSSTQGKVTKNIGSQSPVLLSISSPNPMQAVALTVWTFTDRQWKMVSHVPVVAGTRGNSLDSAVELHQGWPGRGW